VAKRSLRRRATRSSKSKLKTAVRRAGKKRKISVKKRAVVKSASPNSDLNFSFKLRSGQFEEILGAAYLMMDRAFVLVEGDKKTSVRVSLRPKSARDKNALQALKTAFEAELSSQKIRWAVSRNNRDLREYVAENALALNEEFASRKAPAAEPPAENLTADQRAEIERLIAEVETEISQMNAKNELPDPKAVAQSWEAAQEQDKKPGGAAA
jgi:His-Xaa-Ser system protein HxsD